MHCGTRAGSGRKPINIDLVELEKLSSLQCTDNEMAAWFNVSVRTIESRRKQPQFAEVMQRGRAKGRISVRRLQLRHAEAGNATLAIWLGKQERWQQAAGGQVRVDCNGLTLEQVRQERSTHGQATL